MVRAPFSLWSMFGVPALGETLVSLVEVALHRGACRRCIVSRDRIQNGPVLGDRPRPLAGIVVMMLEPGEQRTHALFPEHLHHGDQRSVTRRFGDAQMEQP